MTPFRHEVREVAGRRSPAPRRASRSVSIFAALACQLMVLGTAGFAAGHRLGPGAVVTASGVLTATGLRGYCSIGQAVSGSASGGEWSTGAGGLTTVIEQVAVDVTPTLDPVVAGQDVVPVEVELRANETPRWVRIHFRTAGRVEYATLDLTASEDGRWTAEVPIESAGLRGVEYYLEVQLEDRRALSPAGDPVGHPWQVPVHVTDATGNGALRTSPGIYRMVSVPARLDDPSLSALLIDDLGRPNAAAWRCGRWNPSTRKYQELGVDSLGPIGPAQAYWVRTRDARTLDFSGASVFPDRAEGFGVTLAPGWNQIGNPFAYNVRVSEARVDDGLEVRTFAEAVAAGLLEAAPLHRYDGQRYVHDSLILESYQGCFVANLSNRPLALVLPAREADLHQTGKTELAAAEEALDWQISFCARQEGTEASAVELATSSRATAGWDPCDRLQAPPAPGEALTFCSISDSLQPAVSHLQRDARLTDPDGESWLLELAAGGTEPVEITWSAAEASATDRLVRLVDLDGGHYVDCGPEGTYSARPAAGARRFRVFAGQAEWVGSQTESYRPFGTHFAATLAGRCPSPGQTYVRLMLEQPERIGMSVYDVNGRLVYEAGDRDLLPGVHLLAWEGRESHGYRAPSGVYFIRVTSAHRSATLRSLIVH